MDSNAIRNCLMDTADLFKAGEQPKSGLASGGVQQVTGVQQVHPDRREVKGQGQDEEMRSRAGSGTFTAADMRGRAGSGTLPSDMRPRAGTLPADVLARMQAYPGPGGQLIQQV